MHSLRGLSQFSQCWLVQRVGWSLHIVKAIRLPCRFVFASACLTLGIYIYRVLLLFSFLNLYPTTAPPLLGWGFSLVFAATGLFAGRFCDSSVGRTLHVTSIALWSGATIFQAGCRSFICLLSMRVIVGIGQAFNAPACYRVISHRFKENERPTANGI